MFTLEPMEPRRLLAASILRIDVGGDGHVEASGKTWAADRGFTAGTTAGSGAGAVAGTAEDPLFDTRRYGNFSYSLPIKNGSYKVKFLFSDPVYSAPDQRLFDVALEKKWMLQGFDIAAAAGGASDTAVVKTANVTVRDGRLNLWFKSVKENAIVSAIEVLPVAPAVAWRELAAAPLPRFEAQGEVIGDQLYIFGGFRSDDIKTTARSHVFDSTTGAWREIAPLPFPLTHAATAVDFHYIYLAGGFIGDWKGANTPVSRKVFRYDTLTNTWTSMLQLPQDRGGGALVRVGRKLHFFGGLDHNFRDRAEHWTLDLRNPTVWREDTPMPNPRNHLGAALVGTKIYAIGGQKRLDEASGNVADVHAFDVIDGTWSRVADLPEPRSHTHNATLVIGGSRLVIVGGSANGPTTVTDLLEYDPLRDRWELLAQMPAARSAAVARMMGDHIIVTGGTTVDIAPKTDTWISV